MDFLKEPEIGVKNNSCYTGEGEETDVSGFAVRGGDGEVQIVVYSHCNDRDKKAEQQIRLHVEGLEKKTVTVSHYRIDAEHSNPYAEWLRQGMPLYPKGEQYAAIKARDGLEELCGRQERKTEDGKLELTFVMPAHGISYIRMR